MKSYHVKVPNYWPETGKWFNNQNGDFRVLVLPQNPPEFYCGLPYKWGYGTADITPYLIHQPLIEERAGLGCLQGLSSASQELTSLALKHFQSNLSSVYDIKAILSLMNVKYILQRNDVDWELISSANSFLYSPEHIKTVLKTQEGIRLEKTFGELDIYEIDDMHFLPRVYATRETILVSGDIDEIFEVVTKNCRWMPHPLWVRRKTASSEH